MAIVGYKIVFSGYSNGWTADIPGPTIFSAEFTLASGLPSNPAGGPNNISTDGFVPATGSFTIGSLPSFAVDMGAFAASHLNDGADGFNFFAAPMTPVGYPDFVGVISANITLPELPDPIGVVTLDDALNFAVSLGEISDSTFNSGNIIFTAGFPGTTEIVVETIYTTKMQVFAIHDDVPVSSVPEPATAGLLGIALLAGAVVTRFRRTRA